MNAPVEYSLQLTLHGEHLTRTLAVDTTDPIGLAQEVHRHARGTLHAERVTIHLDETGLAGTVTSHGTHAGTFALQPRQLDHDRPAKSDGIRWGWTMDDLHAGAAAACRADRSLASDAHTRYDVAWSAIASALCEAEEPPTREALVRVGWQAIYREVREMRVMFGFKDRDGTNGVATAPRFVQYWTVPPTTHDERLIERMAVGQIVDTLTDPYRDAVVALAVHGNYQAAADALGINYKALVARIGTARKHLRSLWFAPETAPPVKGTDRRVGAYGKELATHCRKGGHEFTPENTYWRAGRAPGRPKVRTCRTCETQRGRDRLAQRKAAA